MRDIRPLCIERKYRREGVQRGQDRAEISGRHSIFHEGGEGGKFGGSEPRRLAAIQLRSMKSLSRDLCPLPSISAKTMIHGSLFRHARNPDDFSPPPTRKRGGTPTYVSLPREISSIICLIDSTKSLLYDKSLTSTNLEEGWKENLLDFPSSNNRGIANRGRRFAYNRASFDDVSFRAFPTLLFSADARRPPHVPRTSGYNTRWAGWQPVIFYRPGEKLSTPSTRARVYYLRFIYSIEW